MSGNTTPSTANHSQWLRRADLIVSDGTSGIDMSELHFSFQVNADDVLSPNTADIRVWNPAPQTVTKIWGGPGAISEFKRVTLQAGYKNGAYGVVFDGTIVQLRAGKANGTDSYLDIHAANYDRAFNFATVNRSFPAGSTAQQRVDAVVEGMNAYGVTLAGGVQITGGILPRGKVLFGLGRDELRLIGKSTGHTWTFQDDGTIVAIPLTGYLPNEIVVLNSETGLVGRPEVTQNGISANCLLNPRIQVGNRVKIDNKALNRTKITNRTAGGPNSPAATGLLASEAADGVYRVVVHEMEGDTRGNAWYSKLILLSLDQSSIPDASIQEFP